MVLDDAVGTDGPDTGLGFSRRVGESRSYWFTGSSACRAAVHTPVPHGILLFIED